MSASEAIDREPAGKAAGEPGIVAFLDCLAQLDGRIRLVVDRDGMIVARPRLASSFLGNMIGDNQPASRGNGGVASRIAAAPRLAERLLRVRGDETEIAMLESADGGGPIIVRASAIDDRHVCILFLMASAKRSGRIEELGSLFGLTACEAQVVLDMIEGRSPAAIADRRGNSIHTIRAHIRQCHQKIGAKTREEMLSRIARICL